MKLLFQKKWLVLLFASFVCLLLVVEASARLLTTPRNVAAFTRVANERFVNIEGGEMGYYMLSQHANAPIVVLLHGIGDLSRSNRELANQLLAEGFTVLAPDLIGHGGSTPLPLDFGPSDGAALSLVLDDAQARLGQQGQKVGVYGPSYGGSAAVHLCARDARVQALVVASTFAELTHILPAYSRRFFGFALPSWLTELALWRASMMTHHDMHVRPVIVATRRPVPTLVIHGLQDDRIDASEGRALATAMHARFLGIPGRGHDNALTDEATTEMIRHFRDHLQSP